MDNKSLEGKWFNYFCNMRHKYNMRISAKKPLVIFLDAKDSSKYKRNLMKGYENDFFDCMCKTAKYFTQKYNCVSIWGTDEISFIIDDVDTFIDSINNDKTFRSHDIVSVFSQYFFEYFNGVYKSGPVYWHCKCFNISPEKKMSYIKFKSHGLLKGITSNFLKQNGVKNAARIRLDEKLKMCEEYENFSSISDYKYGVLYLNGQKIDVNDYFDGKITVLDETNNSYEVLDLMDFE